MKHQHAIQPTAMCFRSSACDTHTHTHTHMHALTRQFERRGDPGVPENLGAVFEVVLRVGHAGLGEALAIHGDEFAWPRPKRTGREVAHTVHGLFADESFDEEFVPHKERDAALRLPALLVAFVRRVVPIGQSHQLGYRAPTTLDDVQVLGLRFQPGTREPCWTRVAAPAPRTRGVLAGRTH